MSAQSIDATKNSSLKNLAATVYLCQVLTFMLAGIPLLVGVAINFFKREAVEGTWLESHFEWQIKTTCLSLVGFMLTGFTMSMGVGAYILGITVVWMVYRIAIGWFTLHDNKAIDNRMY